MLHIVIVLTYFTLVGNILSVQVEVVIFGMIEDDNIFKYELNTVYFKRFDRKDARVVFSKLDQ